MPILVGPVAFQLLAHADGEAGMARAAKDAGTVMCLSSLTSTRPAEVAEAAPGGRLWMQVYLFRDRGVTRAMVEEAAEAGYEALLLTVDAPYAGQRERDLRIGFQVPAEIRAPAIEAAVGHGASPRPRYSGSSIPRSPGRTSSSSAASSICRSWSRA